MNKKLSCMLLAALMLCTTSVTAFAADKPVEITEDDMTVKDEEGVGLPTVPDIVDEETLGTISVQLTDGKQGTSKSGIKFVCTKVADIEKGEYIKIDAFKDVDVDLNKLNSAKDLESAAAKFAKKADAASSNAVTDENGKLVFSDLEVGVYLIAAEDKAEYDVITPSLVAVPTWNEENGEMSYEMAVEPKHSPRPDKPGENPNAPQTNVDSPVLLYFGGAAILIVAGVVGNVIYKKHKKK